MAVIKNNQMAADNGWIVGDRKPLSTAHGHVGNSVGIIMELPPDAGNGLYDPQQRCCWFTSIKVVFTIAKT